MIAITFALPAESSGLVSKFESKRVSREKGLAIVSGTVAGREVAIFHTGVGRKQCRRTLEPFLQSIRPPMLISSGFAGSLTDELRVGNLIIARDVSDAELAKQLAIPANENTRSVRLLTVERMVDNPEERARIAREDSAAAIDMETDVIADACGKYAIPMVSLRVISDSPSAPFPAPPDVLFDIARQRTNFGRLVPYVLRHPSAVGRLSRFAQQISHARAVLTDALVAVVTNAPLG